MVGVTIYNKSIFIQIQIEVAIEAPSKLFKYLQSILNTPQKLIKIIQQRFIIKS
jgi:hypothetical protein